MLEIRGVEGPAGHHRCRCRGTSGGPESASGLSPMARGPCLVPGWCLECSALVGSRKYSSGSRSPSERRFPGVVSTVRTAELTLVMRRPDREPLGSHAPQQHPALRCGDDHTDRLFRPVSAERTNTELHTASPTCNIEGHCKPCLRCRPISGDVPPVLGPTYSPMVTLADDLALPNPR